MANRNVPSTLTDLEWIRCLGGRLWLQERHRSYGPQNGYRNPRQRITREEFDRIKRVVRDHDLPYKIFRTSYGTELAVYVQERGREREIMRLTHHHIPSHSYDTNHRRIVATRMFKTFAEELHRHRTQEVTPS